MKKYKSQCKAVEVTLNSKEENSSDSFWISSKNSASEVYMYTSKAAEVHLAAEFSSYTFSMIKKLYRLTFYTTFSY